MKTKIVHYAIMPAVAMVASESEIVASYEAELASQQPIEVLADSQPDTRQAIIYRHNCRYLPVEGGQILLRLRDDLQVALESGGRECSVEGWGVRVPVQKVYQLPGILARQFLKLFSKADAGTLDDQEKEVWLSILERVDYRRFSVDRAEPHYLEGEILQKQPKWVLVEWHDGEKVRIPYPAARALGALEIGDIFGARVKLGLDDDVRSIEAVRILEAV